MWMCVLVWGGVPDWRDCFCWVGVWFDAAIFWLLWDCFGFGGVSAGFVDCFGFPFVGGCFGLLALLCFCLL